MRGSDAVAGSLFSYVDLEKRVRADHPLRVIRGIVNATLAAMSAEFDALYAPDGRESIPPERLLRALLLQAFYTIRSERQLVERIEFDPGLRRGRLCCSAGSRNHELDPVSEGSIGESGWPKQSICRMPADCPRSVSRGDAETRRAYGRLGRSDFGLGGR